MAGITPLPGDVVTQAEAEELAELHMVDARDICRGCGKKITIQIFRGTGHCSDNCRKKRNGERPTPPGPALPG